jgi:hypothetical protein
VAKLDKRGKQNLLKLLQKEFPKAAPAAQPTQAAPASTAEPAAAPAATQPTPAAQPVQAAPAAQATAEPVAKKTRSRKKPAAPSQAEIDADRERLMGVTSDSVIKTGNPLAETLAARVEQHKRRMFEQNLRTGQTSIFVK